MRSYALTHLSDAVLLRELADLIAFEKAATAMLLAHLAEVDARRLYVPAGHSSMFAYCVDELHLSEDAAYKRIRAARASRQFPALFDAIADGRLHLAAVGLIAPHLSAENVEEVIAAASHRRKDEIEEWLARRFAPSGAAGRAFVPTIRRLPRLAPERVGNAPGQLALGRVGGDSAIPEPVEVDSELAPVRVEGDKSQPVPGDGQLAPERVERFLVQVAIGKSTHDKLCYLQRLLSHSVPAGDLAQVLDRALDALIAQLEKRKLGAASSRPLKAPDQPSPLPSAHAAHPTEGSGRCRGPRARRYIPAPIRRAVWERDQGQCTFVGPAGQRCTARSFLEFDHVRPVARGGKATVETIRLRCRAHNQHEADRVFGAEFMKRKREEARRARRRALGDERGDQFSDAALKPVPQDR